jgi:nitroreductase
MADAQAVLLIAGDLSGFAKRAARAGRARQREWCQATAGCIAQNVYLAAAAFKLGTVMAAGLNADVARKGLALGEDEIPLYIMPLGYPKAE